MDFTRCRKVWVPDNSEVGGTWNPPPPHVEVGVKFIVDHPYALLADDMGGMKSAQSIIAAQFLHEVDQIDRVIVIAPAAIRPKVWFDQDLGQLREQLWDDKLNIVSEYHRKIRRWEHGPKDARPLKWIVTNYEFIRGSNVKELLNYCGPKTFLILDESSAVRGDSAQTDACMSLRWLTNAKGRPILGAPRCGRILEMNGTPIAEGLLDLFYQGNLLHPSILDCRYVTHYKARYANLTAVMERGKPMMRHGKVVQSIAGWHEDGVKDVQRRFAPYILRREAKEFGKDWALEPIGLEVALTPPTWRIYRDMRDEMVAWLQSGVATARQAGVKSIRLSQITSGFLGGIEDLFFDLDEEGQVVERAPVQQVQEVGREKLDYALEWHSKLLKEQPDLKLLTWCRFVPELQRYLREEQLAHPFIPIGAACGQKVIEDELTKREERDQALRLLHPKTAPSGPVTVGATQGTGAMGLNFTACRTVLDMSYDFSPLKKKQGDARVNRTGQIGPVSFYYLIAVGPKGQKTIDHHVMMERTGKMKVNDLTVSAWISKLKEE